MPTGGSDQRWQGADRREGSKRAAWITGRPHLAPACRPPSLLPFIRGVNHRNPSNMAGATSSVARLRPRNRSRRGIAESSAQGTVTSVRILRRRIALPPAPRTCGIQILDASLPDQRPKDRAHVRNRPIEQGSQLVNRQRVDRAHVHDDLISFGGIDLSRSCHD